MYNNRPLVALKVINLNKRKDKRKKGKLKVNKKKVNNLNLYRFNTI